MTYLNDDQIEEMAHAAFAAYEVSANKRSAIRAAKEHAIDEFGIEPNGSAVLLAFNIAMTQWEGDKIAARMANS